MTIDEIITHALDEFLDPRNRLQGVIARLRLLKEQQPTPYTVAERWIPVGERLPQLDEEVLIYHVLGDVDRQEVPHAVDTARLFADGWHFPWDRGDHQRPFFVTHWRPLPGAPK